MSRDDQGGRRYTEEEFALILRRASEISTAADTSPGGLSLPEMQQIAKEAGIDPAAVAKAAHSLPEPSRQTLAIIFGGPMKYRLERTVLGKASEEDLGRILQAIRRTAEHQGRTKHILGSVEWRTSDQEAGTSKVFVNVTSHDEGTTIEVIGDRQEAGFLAYMLSGIAAVMGSALLRCDPRTRLDTRPRHRRRRARKRLHGDSDDLEPHGHCVQTEAGGHHGRSLAGRRGCRRAEQGWGQHRTGRRRTRCTEFQGRRWRCPRQAATGLLRTIGTNRRRP